jgi:hypothetical protein
MQQCFINYNGQTKHYFACDAMYVCSVLNALLITYTLVLADSIHKACIGPVSPFSEVAFLNN